MATLRARADGLPPNILDLDVEKPYTGQVSISHEAAALLLPEYNKGNRRVRKALVNYLLRQIQNGEWQSDHPQPIVFSADGRLIDGQHRLFAIAESGRTVLAMVVTGVRDALREYIDTGISRQLEDRVEFSSDPGQNQRLAQLVNQFASLQTGRPRGTSKPTPSEALDIFTANKEGFMFSAHYMGRRIAGLCAAPVMVALAEYHSRDRDRATAFCESLLATDGDIQPARRLREHLIRRSAQGATAGGQARLDIYLKSVGAMRAHMEGRIISSLRSSTWAG